MKIKFCEVSLVGATVVKRIQVRFLFRLLKEKLMIIGLDLGAKFGYAVLDKNGFRIDSGTLKLGKRTGDSQLVLWDRLTEIISTNYPSAVGYEEVRGRHSSLFAAHAYGGYQSIVMMATASFSVNLVGVTVQQIKKLATGAGRAEKEEIICAANDRWFVGDIDSNEADALWCAEVTRQLLYGK